MFGVISEEIKVYKKNRFKWIITRYHEFKNILIIIFIYRSHTLKLTFCYTLYMEKS